MASPRGGSQALRAEDELGPVPPWLGRRQQELSGSSALKPQPPARSMLQNSHVTLYHSSKGNLSESNGVTYCHTPRTAILPALSPVGQPLFSELASRHVNVTRV